MVCSLISVPAAAPFTLQTFGVFVILVILGWKKGCAAILLYILLELIGLPVFSGAKGGPAALFGPTGGYILGFLLTGHCYWLYERLGHERVPAQSLSLLLGLVLPVGRRVRKRWAGKTLIILCFNDLSSSC